MTPDISIAWLLLNIVVIAITLIWGIYRYRRGIWYRKLSLKFQAYLLWGIGGLALLSSFYPYSWLYTEHLWFFENVGYPDVFWKIIKLRWGLFFGFFFAALLFMNLNAIIAKRLCPEPREFSRWVHDETVSFHRTFFCGSILIAIIFAVPMMSLHDEYILYKGQPKEEKVVLANAKQAEPEIGDVEQQDTETTDVDQETTEIVKAESEDDDILDFEQLDTEVAIVNVNENPKTETRFFGKDVNFYMFTYPMHNAISLWVWLLLWVSCIVVGLLYNFYYRRDARSMGFVKRNIVLHGSILWLILLAVAIWRGYVNLWGKVYTPSLSDRLSAYHGLFYADSKLAGSTHVYSIVLIIIGVVVIFNLFWRKRKIWYALIVISLISYLCLIQIYPIGIHWYTVRTAGDAEEPELEFLASHIKDTRKAFDINNISEKDFDKGLTTIDLIEENPEVKKNIQFWDRRVFYNILRNEQPERHHDFHPYADVDRYYLTTKPTPADSSPEPSEDNASDGTTEVIENTSNGANEEEGDYRQVLISAREIDPDPGHKEWGELKLKFTHGYGVCLAPVNVVSENDTPDLWVKGVPITQKEGLNYQELDISQPRIYYGEMTHDYVIVNTEKPEYNVEEEKSKGIEKQTDLTENKESETEKEVNKEEQIDIEETENLGDINNGYHYEGTGGVRLGGWFRRFCYAVRFTSVYILRHSALNQDSRVMYWRKIGTRHNNRLVVDRISHIAPFLDYDPDPYIVIHDGQLWWMVDFYVTSSRYPNSQFYKDDTAPIKYNELELHTEPRFKRFKKFNYIRNSGVAVVNAYSGEIKFYTEDDELITSIYQKTFPTLFNKISDMPEGLKGHRRFPDYLNRIQAKIYGSYHVTKARNFYDNNDQWKIPKEAYYTESPNQEMMPYYIMLKLPGEEKTEFVNMIPFTPPFKDNFMKGWLITRCDPPNYGERIVYTLPDDINVKGPKHVEDDIPKNPELAELFRNWKPNRVIRGNLHVIPIEEGIFYVEPIYFQRISSDEAESDDPTDPTLNLPTLQTIVVKAADRELAADISFDTALRKVYLGKQPAATPETENGEKEPTTLDHLDALAKAIEDLRKAYINEQNGAAQKAPPKNQGKKKQNKKN